MENSTNSEALKIESLEQYGEAYDLLNTLIWQGKYDEALPLADKVLDYRTSQGDRMRGIINYASNYYSAASRLYQEKGLKEGKKIAQYMNTAIRAVHERVEHEIEEQGGKKEGMLVVSFAGMSANELDVVQSVYRRAGEMADKIPLVQPLRQLVTTTFPKTKNADPIRDFDAGALFAIREGLKKIKEEVKAGKKVDPHTEIFLRGGAFQIAQKYGWTEASMVRANRIFKLIDTYPWPDTVISPKDVLANKKQLSEYGQAVRVARLARNIAHSVEAFEKQEEYDQKANIYAEYVPDQKAKL